MRMRLHDVAFHELRGIVEYQLGKYGKGFILVDPRNSSKTCAKCGYVKMDLALSDRVFECPRCGWRADRDYNSALNHLRRAGWESPAAPVELRPLPVVHNYGQGGARKREASPLGAG
ncbi:MAG: hypothetical protein AT710_06300 [Thermocladium sp. ECH_B]|nr:MAG: hypothetical protein AT710_06300 [Thermocladium sp. ECH_B]